MKLAVCLLTADRPEYTAVTVDSFVSLADAPGLIKLHADDGSATGNNRFIAKAGGFETVYATKERSGQLPALRVLWAGAAALGATHILHLENDIDFVSPLPSSLIINAAECVRLYGEYKGQPGTPRARTGAHIIGTQESIVWKRDIADHTGRLWERGVAHWGGMPSITRTTTLLRALATARTFKDIPHTLNRLDTLRPNRNLAWHIGDERTPGAKWKTDNA